MKRAFLSIPAVLLVGSVTPAMATAAQNPQVKVGQAAPDFTTKSIDGKTLRLSSLRGKVVLLNFWTTG